MTECKKSFYTFNDVLTAVIVVIHQHTDAVGVVTHIVTNDDVIRAGLDLHD